MNALLKNSPPDMCGYFSINSDREFDGTASSLRYFKYPTNLPLDLNIGIDLYQAKPNSYFDEKIDNILTYIVNHKADLVSDDHQFGGALIPSTKYITYRGILRKIMLSLYEKRNGWSILITKYKNNLYISQHTKPEERNAFPNERNKMFSYYGLKFVQYCLADDPLNMPDPSQQVDARTQFFGLFKRMLVGRNFLFAAEMAGIASDTPVNLNERGQLNQLKFIGLKVCAEPPTKRRAIYNFRYRFQNVWTQSFLTGVNDVYFGIRNLNGIVRNIEHYSTDDLLRLCESDWNPSKGFSFLDDFLKLVEAETDKTDCPYTVFEFNFSEITLNITCTKHPGKTELSLLPDWYLEAFDA